MSFADMKSLGVVCEFIPEQARVYIAMKRFRSRLAHSEAVQLSDEDQLAIMQKQLFLEKLYMTACPPDTVIVTDTSALNSLLYMSPEFRQTTEVKKLVAMALRHYTLQFYCSTIEKPLDAQDANRVHTYEQSLAIDKSIPNLLKEIGCPMPRALVGNARARAKVMGGLILEKRISDVVAGIR